MDLFSRKIVGWAMGDHMRTELASSALTMAIQQQRPEAGLIHHSDRGVQYASHAYRQALTTARITASMSRKADCYDNAPMESFFHTLKTELVHHRDYQTRAQAMRDVFAYYRGLLQPHPAPFRHRICHSDRDGAKSSLTLSTFLGEDQTPSGRPKTSRPSSSLAPPSPGIDAKNSSQNGPVCRPQIMLRPDSNSIWRKYSGAGQRRLRRRP
ncbi:hypothetical protein ACVIHI_000015 [Bradyrhizobium sp. USDA 4524]|nr:hypothetical protein [Bradyrhizobium sp. USDA 4537]MCP1986700.1 hypothetical protein [Bradyrhizobium sp. USDA 4539]